MDEPADRPLPDLAAWLGRLGHVVTSPATRCRVPGGVIEEDLRPWDLGTWTGRRLADLPDLVSWRDDPAWAGHGGESLLDLQHRVTGLLDRWHDRPERRAAITHASVIRAALTHVLRAPPEAAWDIDISPSSSTELHTTPRGWRVVHVNAPLT